MFQKIQSEKLCYTFHHFCHYFLCLCDVEIQTIKIKKKIYIIAIKSIVCINSELILLKLTSTGPKL